MTDAEILRMKLNLADCALNDKGIEEFLAKTDDFHDVFSLRDEIGTCPFIEVHLKLKDETPFFVQPYPMCVCYTILWITYIPLPLNGYEYEHESTDLATIHGSCISR